MTVVVSVWLFYWSILTEKKHDNLTVRKFPFAPRFIDNNEDDDERTKDEL